MRLFSAIGAAFLIAGVAPATSHADTAPAVAATASQPAAPGCHCPVKLTMGLHHRHAGRYAGRPHRHVRFHAGYWRRWRPARIAVAPPPFYWPPYYNPPIPSPEDSAYDRGMTLLFRSPAVSGFYIAEPGYPPTPPILGVQPYRFQAGGAVFQYDGITGECIMLSQYDALRALGVAGVPR